MLVCIHLYTGTSVKIEQCSMLCQFTVLALSGAHCHVTRAGRSIRIHKCSSTETGSCDMGLRLNDVHTAFHEGINTSLPIPGIALLGSLVHL